MQIFSQIKCEGGDGSDNKHIRLKKKFVLNGAKEVKDKKGRTTFFLNPNNVL